MAEFVKNELAPEVEAPKPQGKRNTHRGSRAGEAVQKRKLAWAEREESEKEDAAVQEAALLHPLNPPAIILLGDDRQLNPLDGLRSNSKSRLLRGDPSTVGGGGKLLYFVEESSNFERYRGKRSRSIPDTGDGHRVSFKPNGDPSSARLSPMPERTIMTKLSEDVRTWRFNDPAGPWLHVDHVWIGDRAVPNYVCACQVASGVMDSYNLYWVERFLAKTVGRTNLQSTIMESESAVGPESTAG
ncbi:MAG: hypothetical protein M1816_006291 [Peltula sp. TS41687]|nr:MAG: hypothetical protein M1816_006291 [Peltula sp. TS41687]